jgi:S-adenosylmethionine decarboxylase
MAYQDALFQLGMDLTRSSPAQEEDTAVAARVVPVDRDEVSSAPASFRPVSVDLVGAGELSSVRAVERAVAKALSFGKAKLIKADLKRAPKTGAIIGTVTSTGGRVTVEAWPSTGYIAIDLAGTIRPEIVLTAFADAFDAREAVLRRQRTSQDGARYKVPAVPVKGALTKKAA